jgi:DNA-binding response OmpR family regulator
VAARILIVEDSALVTDAFEVLFGEAGYEVDSARTVAEAVGLGKKKSVDVMLLDLTLPDGNGLEVLDALRGHDRLPRATLAMTGDSDPDTRRKCLEAGCTDILVKPVPIRDLLRQIERLLA